MKQKLLGILAVPAMMGLCSLPGSSFAQNCIPTSINGSVIDLVCPQSCTNLNFRIPHIKGTSDYTVNSIAFSPDSFVTANGTELVALYADDIFSGVINLPFPFCFYDAVYNSCVVGSNGLITFDISNANLANAWSLTTVPHGAVPQPIPYAGGVQNSTTTTYYPRASIMGPYHDIYPLLNTPQKRIEYSVAGTAPCRRFIVSYYLIPLYGSVVCNGRFNTQQIVMHESTGIIDIYLADKSVCNAWNQGLAILGLQNWNRDQAVAAPGKNCTVWSESGTAYRFTPSGTGSRYIRSEIYTLSGSLVATADTLTTVPGMLDLRFLNFCPPAGSTQYEVRTSFSSCSNPSTILVSSDTITVNRNNSLNATATTTNNACGPPSGTITVNVPAGTGVPPYTYLLDGGPPFTGGNSHTFTSVIHGPHVVTVTDAGGNCSSILNVTVNRSNALTSTITTTQTYCAGSASGSITATATNGVGPYTYILNGGSPVTGGSPYTFNGLSAGTHTLVISDATGCMSNTLSITVTDGPGVLANANSTATTCPSVSNGTITINVTSGLSPFNYQLDGGAVQSGGTPFTFSNVASGPHTILITDNVGCTKSISVTVAAGPALTANNSTTATSCNGAADGTITVTPVNGAGPFSFSLDAGSPVPGSVPFTFSGQVAGTHTIQVFDAAGCLSPIYAVMVAAGPDLQSTAVATNVLCNGDATGSITVNQPGSGTPPFQYSLDGINWQPGRVFNGLPAGTYTVRFRSANGCNGFLTKTITEPPSLVSTAAITPVICYGESNGIIRMTSSGGVGPYQYAINGGPWQSNNQFTVAAGTYDITIRDANNCSLTKNVTVTEPALLTAVSSNTDATCDGGNNGTITVNANGGNGNYQYSLNGGSFQASNVFNAGPGIYNITVKDILGCLTSFSTTVGLTFNLFMNPMPDPTICEGTSIQLQPVSNATVYSWSPPANLSNPNIPNPVAFPSDTSWYYLTAVLGRCTLRDTIRLNVIPAPVPDAGPDGEICYGKSYTLQGNGGMGYTWSPALYLNSISVSNPVSTPSITTVYNLSVTDVYGCRSLVKDTVKVSVKREMSVRTIPFDTVAAPGQQIPLLAVSRGITYSWIPATGLSDARIPDPILSTSSVIGDQMTYQVVAVDSAGCKGEGYVHVKIFSGPAIYVPSAFSPNGDGLNDLFTPFPVGIKSYNYFRVFNRWGQLLFSTRQLNQGWDGTFGGSAQPTGIYVWMIEGLTSDNHRITKKGTLTLLR